MNAKEFSKAVEEARKINGLDEWITTEMLEKAASPSNIKKNSVTFSSSYFYNKGWPGLGDAVADLLVARGFKVQKHCDLRGDVWYEISW